VKLWWHKLSQRERSTVAIGGSIIVILLCYVLIVTPMNHALHSLKQRVIQQQSLLQWMQSADQQLNQLQQHQGITTPIDTNNLLAFINQSSRSHKLNQFMTDINQTSHNQVRIRFVNVPFDNWVSWLQSLWQQHTISVTQLMLTPKSTAGVAAATVTLVSG